MKNIMIKLIKGFNKLSYWLRQKDHFDIPRAVLIDVAVFILAVGACYFAENEDITRTVVFFCFVAFYCMLPIWLFDAEDKAVRRISKGFCNTPRELMRKMSHGSYFYGLFFFSLEICTWLTMIIGSIGVMISGTFVIIDIYISWIIAMFAYTFLYFSYHIYFTNSEKTIEMVKQRIQLYAALGTTISFFMLVVGENRMLKIFVMGTMLEYTWLQYLITEQVMKKDKSML